LSIFIIVFTLFQPSAVYYSWCCFSNFQWGGFGILFWRSSWQWTVKGLFILFWFFLFTYSKSKFY